MRKVVSLLLVGSSLLLFVGCARTGGSPQAPAPITAPAVSDSAPSPAAPEPAKPGTAPARPGALPAPAVKQDARRLYPAYAFIDGARKWGYIDPAGKFAIQPAFDRAAEFESDGLAIVQQGAKTGLINKDGTLVVAPAWDRIEPANGDLVRVLFNGEDGKAVDSAGKPLFAAPLVTANFGSGLAPYRNADRLFGYVNRKGEIVVPAQFRSAYAFQDGKAIVQVGEKTFAVIDTTGKRLGEYDAGWATTLSENLIAFPDKSSDLWGYASVNGQVVLPAAFGQAGHFKDGLAVVSTAAPYGRRVKGLINTKGEFVIPEQYGALNPLSAGLYAAAKPTQTSMPDMFRPMALLTREDRQLTGFQYYNLQPVAQGLISVSDGKETYFLDSQGKRAPGMPSVAGFGTLQLEGSLIKADVDGRVRYLDRNGQVVWQSDNTITLAGGLRVVEQMHRPNRAALVFYPEFAGLSDPKAQEALNQRLRTEFVGSARDSVEEPSMITDVQFSVRQMNGLVVIYATRYMYGWGAAHGSSSRTYYHIDAKTGTIYTLADLFKKDSKFTDRLSEIIRKQITIRQDKSTLQQPQVNTSQAFYISADALTIYYPPGDIGSNGQGFIEFAIPWSEVSDLIDTNGPFWKSFH